MLNKFRNSKQLKNCLITLIIFTILYALFNYLPWEEWLGGEVPYLIVKILFYGITSAIIVILKHRNEVEIETPYRQISMIWLIPLAISIFTNFLYILVVDEAVFKEIEPLVLILDVISDIPVSIFEDVLFIDIFVFMLIELVGNDHHGKLLSIIIAAIVFTAIHSYSFIYEKTIAEVFIALLTVFMLSLECGYLAVYFNSALVPIGYHLLYNEVNSVIFHSVLDMEMDKQYILFYSIIILLNLFYIIGLYRISVLQKYKDLCDKEEKAELEAEVE